VLPYWLLFSVCAAGAIEYRRRGVHAFQGGPLLFLTATLVAVLIGLRYEVGGDWINYLDMFEQFRHTDLVEALVDSDPGFTIFNYLAHRFGVGIWFVNFSCAVLFSAGLLTFARAQPNPWLAFVVAVPYLIIVVAMGYTRQAVAIGILLAGLGAFQRDESIVRFAGYLFLAALFHKSAVIILPFAAMAVAKRNFITTGGILLLGAILATVFLRGSVDKLMTNYVEAGYSSQGAAVRIGMNLPPALLFLVYKQRFVLSPIQARLWTYLSWAALGSMASLLFVDSTTALDRLALYLIPLQLFVLTRMPYAFPVRGLPNGQVALMVIIYSAAVQFVWLNYAVNSEFWLPYRFYPLEEEPVPPG
jgi:hypothetical protein